MIALSREHHNKASTLCGGSCRRPLFLYGTFSIIKQSRNTIFNLQLLDPGSAPAGSAVKQPFARFPRPIVVLSVFPQHPCMRRRPLFADGAPAPSRRPSSDAVPAKMEDARVSPHSIPRSLSISSTFPTLVRSEPSSRDEPSSPGSFIAQFEGSSEAVASRAASRRFVELASVGRDGTLGFEVERRCVPTGCSTPLYDDSPARSGCFEAAGIEPSRYREEGDRSLYSQANLRARTAARRDPGVRKLIELFYQTCVIDASTNASARLVHDVARYRWVELHLRMLKALLTARDWDEVRSSRIYRGRRMVPSQLAEPDERDRALRRPGQAAARATVEQDWRRAIAEQPRRPSAPTGKGERESGDGNVISREAFVESLSELVDVWAVGTSGDEYQSFLRTLFLRITWPTERTEGGAGSAAAMGRGGVRRNSARRGGAGRAGGDDVDAADGGPANRRPMRPLRHVQSSDERPSSDDADEDGCVDGLLGALSTVEATDMRSRGRRRNALAPIRDPAAADAAVAAAPAKATAQLAAADAAAAPGTATAQAVAKVAAAVAAAAAAAAAATAAAEQQRAAASRDGRRVSLKGEARRLSNPAVRNEMERRRPSSQPTQNMTLHGDEDGVGPTIAMFDRPATGSTRQVRLPSFSRGFAGAIGQRLTLPALIAH